MKGIKSHCEKLFLTYRDYEIEKRSILTNNHFLSLVFRLPSVFSPLYKMPRSDIPRQKTGTRFLNFHFRRGVQTFAVMSTNCCRDVHNFCRDIKLLRWRFQTFAVVHVNKHCRRFTIFFATLVKSYYSPFQNKSACLKLK